MSRRCGSSKPWKPLLGTNLLEVSTGRGFGALEGSPSFTKQTFLGQNVQPPVVALATRGPKASKSKPCFTLPQHYANTSIYTYRCVCMYGRIGRLWRVTLSKELRNRGQLDVGRALSSSDAKTRNTQGSRTYQRSWAGKGGRGGYSFVACLSYLTIDHASLSRRSTVPTPNRDTSNIWTLSTVLPYMAHENVWLFLAPSSLARHLSLLRERSCSRYYPMHQTSPCGAHTRLFSSSLFVYHIPFLYS